MTTVNVECKLPTGVLLKLPGHAPVTLRGTNTQPANQPQAAAWGRDTRTTPGVTIVDEAFITAWLAANAHLPCVTKGLISISPTPTNG